MSETIATLLAVSPDGTLKEVPCTYEGIKAGVGGGIIDLVRPHDEFAMFIDDEGMLNRQELNVPGSLMAGMSLYGSVVLVNGEPDDEGNTLAPDLMIRQILENLARRWRAVEKDMARKGQTMSAPADPDSIPPAVVQSFDTWEEMSEFLFGEHAE